MRDAFFGYALGMIAQLVLFVGLCSFLELKGFCFAFCRSWSIRLLEAF